MCGFNIALEPTFSNEVHMAIMFLQAEKRFCVNGFVISSLLTVNTSTSHHTLPLSVKAFTEQEACVFRGCLVFLTIFPCLRVRTFEFFIQITPFQVSISKDTAYLSIKRLILVIKSKRHYQPLVPKHTLITQV